MFDERQRWALIAGLRALQGINDAGLDENWIYSIQQGLQKTLLDPLDNTELDELADLIPDAEDYPENHPEYIRGFDYGWHSGRRDAFALVYELVSGELQEIGEADSTSTIIKRDGEVIAK